MTPADKLLPLLDGVRRTGADRGIARCPAHEDRHPSMSWREADDGRLLIKCWGGCSADAIVHGVGLEMHDLFPQREPAPGAASVRRPWSAADLIDVAAFEAMVAVMVTADIVAGKPDADRNRLVKAAFTLADMAEAVHGRH
jgi:hypothetical protein